MDASGAQNLSAELLSKRRALRSTHREYDMHAATRLALILSAPVSVGAQNAIPPVDLKALADSVAPTGTTLERTRTLVHWVNDNFTWSYTDYVNRTPQDIVARRAGNCAELASVLRAFLDASGTKSRWIREINVQPQPTPRRQHDAAAMVTQRGLSYSVFGLQHNDHMWLEVWDDATKSWFPADPAYGVVGLNEWLPARLAMANRPKPRVAAVAPIAAEMLVPFVVVAGEKRSGPFSDDRTDTYLIDGFNNLYGGRLAALPSWSKWVAAVHSLSPHARAAFDGKENLHIYNDDIAKLKKTYDDLSREASAKGIGIGSIADQPPVGTQLLLLGTAAGPPLRADRSEPATLLIVDGRRYLIDCGIGTARRLVTAGIGSETIGTIFLTHLHPDHTLGLADLLANDLQSSDHGPPLHTISIYGPPHTKELVDAAYRYVHVPYEVFVAEGLGPSRGVPASTPFSVHEVGEGVVFQDDKIRVVAAENSHYVLMPGNARATMKSYAYRFETPHDTIVFTGDTGPSDAVVRLAEGADVFVSEVSDFAAVNAFVDRTAQQNHWSPERRNVFQAHMTEGHLDIKDVGQMAAKAHAKAVLLYHWEPVDSATYVAGVAKYFSGPVFAGADLQRYCLPARAPGGQSSGPALHRCE